MPGDVIQRAKSYLQELETQQLSHRNNLQAELPLAVAEPDVEPGRIEQALSDIDPDSLTPREALEILYRLKDLS